MKKLFLFIFIAFFGFCIQAQNKPRVFIFTDINIDSGDPDDRQSLVHLMWYANELKIEGIVPERWNAKSYEACELVLEAYTSDYEKFNLQNKGYPSSELIHKTIARDWDHGKDLFFRAVNEEIDPLYVLVWGNMRKLRDALFERPELAENIRVITIGTGLMLEADIPHLPKSWEKSPPCKQMNWNAFGRNEIFNDSRFDKMWWLELNWTYNGMFTGEEPAQMFQKLSTYGELGKHIKDAVKNEAWAQYFRVGDTPSVLFVIDPNHDFDDPTQSSWAGKFVKPFPEKRPNYYTDYCGTLEWDYAKPCHTWENHILVKNMAKSTLEERREDMYRALLEKLGDIYKK